MVGPLQNTSIHIEVDKRNRPNIKLDHVQAEIQKEQRLKPPLGGRGFVSLDVVEEDNNDRGWSWHQLFGRPIFPL